MKVVIIQRRLTHYRIPLFEYMRIELAKYGVDLLIIYGDPTIAEEKKYDQGVISWGIKVKNKYFNIFNKTFCWIPLTGDLKKFDLVVITQENSIISNYAILLMRLFNKKIAFWGHGANFQSRHKKSLSESFKKYTNRYVHWWFAYTGLSAKLVEDTGFPKNKITNLENTIDISSLEKELKKFNVNHYKKNNIDKTAIFIGSLYSEKRLDFLFEASKIIQKKLPEFKLVIIGDGIERNKVIEFSNQHDWCDYVGFKDTKGKAKYLAEANVILNPGLVGLSILDSFTAGVPMITTDCGLHSPEIAYLDNGSNGLITKNTITDYVENVLLFFRNDELRTTLATGAANSAKYYTIQNMGENFVNGILRSLSVNK